MTNKSNWYELNPNRQYKDIDQRIRDTYVSEGTAQRTHQYDMYKRFIRWASDRLDDDGIIAFITNRAYLDTGQDDGFRKIVGREFTDVYVLDLGSDVRRNPKISGTTHNVFGIQTGVAVGFFVRDKSRLGECGIHYARREDAELASDKLAYLRDSTLEQIMFANITPDRRNDWLNQSDTDFEELTAIANRQTKFAKTASEERAVFGLYSVGISTNRDAWLYDFDSKTLSVKVQFFCKKYQNEVKRFAKEKPPGNSLGAWVDKSIKWTTESERHLAKGDRLAFAEKNITSCLYRPFVTKHSYYAPIITHRRYQMPQIFPHEGSVRNAIICFCVNAKDFYVIASDRLGDLHLTGDTQCLPLYRYTGRTENA